VNEIGFENVKTAAKSLYLVLKLTLHFGGLACLVADVNVHTLSGSGPKESQALCYRRLYTCLFETLRRFLAL
jgi:hypothetical protein